MALPNQNLFKAGGLHALAADHKEHSALLGSQVVGPVQGQRVTTAQ